MSVWGEFKENELKRRFGETSRLVGWKCGFLVLGDHVNFGENRELNFKVFNLEFYQIIYCLQKRIANGVFCYLTTNGRAEMGRAAAAAANCERMNGIWPFQANSVVVLHSSFSWVLVACRDCG